MKKRGTEGGKVGGMNRRETKERKEKWEEVRKEGEKDKEIQ
jgi:hypothetical protein